MDAGLKPHIVEALETLRSDGLFKRERIIQSPQGADIRVPEGAVVNFCANNYLGLSSHPDIIEAARRGLAEWGFGMSSVRFICGTQEIHRQLERKLAAFLGLADVILYSSCFDANGGLFETLLGPEDAVISDALNHASIIDGIRLCKARRWRYAHADMADLARCLEEARDCRVRLIATDGVFSMDGDVAPLAAICDLAERHDAVVMVDDSHATGFMGANGRGTVELCGVEGRVDVITSTLGKALGGATGGFTAGPAYLVDYLRQRSRPYLFSNSVAPAVVAAGLRAVDLLAESGALRERLAANTRFFREQMTALGFDIPPSAHPIVPVMLGEARLAREMADALLAKGIYVIGFSFPVVPKGKARIRVQVSAAHTCDQLETAVEAFGEVGRRFEVIH